MSHKYSVPQLFGFLHRAIHDREWDMAEMIIRENWQYEAIQLYTKKLGSKHGISPESINGHNVHQVLAHVSSSGSYTQRVLRRPPHSEKLYDRASRELEGRYAGRHICPSDSALDQLFNQQRGPSAQSREDAAELSDLARSFMDMVRAQSPSYRPDEDDDDPF